MKENIIPSNYQVPSKGKLIRSTILAIIIAAVILVTIVLPAEYGIDPTGFGQLTGLKRMGEIKVSLAEEAALENENATDQNTPVQKSNPETTTKSAVPEPKLNARSDKFTIVLKPDQGKEIKLTMVKGAEVDYAWYTDGGVANFDAHADSKELEIKYHNYEKGKLQKSEGIMVAAFDGNHGWFWRNRTSQNITVTLEVEGNYTDVIQYD